MLQSCGQGLDFQPGGTVGISSFFQPTIGERCIGGNKNCGTGGEMGCGPIWLPGSKTGSRSRQIEAPRQEQSVENFLRAMTMRATSPRTPAPWRYTIDQPIHPVTGRISTTSDGKDQAAGTTEVQASRVCTK